MDKVVYTNMEQGEDPDSYFMEKTPARSELQTMGEILADRRFKTSVYKDSRRSTRTSK